MSIDASTTLHLTIYFTYILATGDSSRVYFQKKERVRIDNLESEGTFIFVDGYGNDPSQFNHETRAIL